MPFVSITRLRLRSWTYLPVFFVAALRSALQARRAAGNISVIVLRDARNTFWTQSLWRDEAAMRSFMMSGAHQTIMPKLLEWCDEASIVHWTQDSLQPVSWDEGHRRMQHDGRASRVRYPSGAHQRFEIPAPVIGRAGDLRLK
jgi:quinol monooxygenase YgiN